jgi:hypothetical protein
MRQGRSRIRLGEPAKRTAKEGQKNYLKNELRKLKFRSQAMSAGAYNAACQMGGSQ